MAQRALIALMIGIFVLGLAPVHAQPLPPRPTPQPTAGATATPRPARHNAAPQARGRITGTVIDLATGAPTPGISVQIGDSIVASDANGNYGLDGLASGEYLVALVLPAGRGTLEQAPVSVTLAAGATVVQHLAFRSVPLTVATATPMATAMPTAPIDAAMPSQLPATGAADFGWLGWAVLGAVLLGGGVVLRRAWPS